MNCSTCDAANDADALFCSECGKPINDHSAASPAKGRRVYLFALLLIPVVILAGGIGYYKYFLPQGIAAVVNGEEIQLSELDGAVRREQGVSGATEPRFRYQVLNTLITERLVLQEARKAGMTVPQQEITAAVAEAQKSAGLNENAFEHEVAARYVNLRNFEDQLARRLLINKFITNQVIPPNAGPRTAGMALNRWMQEISGRASVRVTLAEQWSGAGCGGCNRAEAAPAGRAASGGCRMAKSGTSPALPMNATSVSAAEQASAAALTYWHAKHGEERVTATVTDFGCHLQVDIIKDNKKIGSLRYQNGIISE